MTELFTKCEAFHRHTDAVEIGYYPFFLEFTGSDGSSVTYKGQEVLMFGANNYLGLSTDPRVKQAACDAINKYGTSCSGSRLQNGTLDLHIQLEQALAKWLGKEKALVFSTGMLANLGTISALVQRHDAILLDKDDHASIVDGALLSHAELLRFQHQDMQSLENHLSQLPADKGKLVVVDGVFSLGGDIADIKALAKLCKQYNARLMVDEAHSLGVLGNGRGAVYAAECGDDVDIIMGTFSKSLASMGGFIAGSISMINYVKHVAHGFVFTASLSPANVAAALAALKIIQEEPERIERVNMIANRVRKELKTMGFNTGNSNTPIIPIIIGEELKTAKMWKMLLENNIFVNLFISPGVPKGSEALRTSYMATHTDAQIDRVLEIYYKAGKAIGII